MQELKIRNDLCAMSPRLSTPGYRRYTHFPITLRLVALVLYPAMRGSVGKAVYD